MGTLLLVRTASPVFKNWARRSFLEAKGTPRPFAIARSGPICARTAGTTDMGRVFFGFVVDSLLDIFRKQGPYHRRTLDGLVQDNGLASFDEPIEEQKNDRGKDKNQGHENGIHDGIVVHKLCFHIRTGVDRQVVSDVLSIEINGGKGSRFGAGLGSDIIHNIFSQLHVVILGIMKVSLSEVGDFGAINPVGFGLPKAIFDDNDNVSLTSGRQDFGKEQSPIECRPQDTNHLTIGRKAVKDGIGQDGNGIVDVLGQFVTILTSGGTIDV
jgi:hypothetical protein